MIQQNSNLPQNKYNEAFSKALNQLNDIQRQAVEQTEGPVMVIAGPGTGKTQLLAARIGNILKTQDVYPQNILAMTFTEAGVVSMQKRLLSFIGPEAYNVRISTYHGFANRIIQENISFFGGYTDLDQLSDLEAVYILREIIDELDIDHTLKKLTGETYFYQAKLNKFFDALKREKVTPEEIETAIKEYKDHLYENPDYLYKRKTGNAQKGDPNVNKIEKKLKPFIKSLEASKLLSFYNKKLNQRRRYDYNDMILWILDAFKKHPDLKSKYQEQYQYILLDEYQDTNGSQNELVYHLLDFWDKPNVFAVGDDDQSIYRFQGANMSNINEFIDKFNPSIFVLQNNYRSGQLILDKASQLINFNTERLSHQIDDVEKQLVESRLEKTKAEVKLLKFQNPDQESIAILEKIQSLVQQSSTLKYSDIAVIYRSHRDVEELVKYCSIKQIGINLRKKENVFTFPHIQQVLTTLQFLAKNQKNPFSQDHLIFEMMHYPYFNINVRDIARLSLAKQRDQNWQDLIVDEKWLNEVISIPDSIYKFGQLISKWSSDIYNYTLQHLIEKIINESGYLNYLLSSSDATFKIQSFNSFYDYIKEESGKAEDYDLMQLVDDIEKMLKHDIRLDFNLISQAKDGINFLTAHSSKGLEYKYVFIIRAIDSVWNNLKGVGNSDFKLPPIYQSEEKEILEENRRLFFVAMTRAKDGLFISYSEKNKKDKDAMPTRFISEIEPNLDDIKTIEIAEDSVNEFLSTIMKFHQGKLSLIDDDLISKRLENYKLSPTDLSKYQKCPRSFYFENILRVPQARTPNMGYGNAIHYALEQYFRQLEADPKRQVPPLNDLLHIFKVGMAKFHQHFTQKEFENYVIQGEIDLTAYYNHHHQAWTAVRKFSPEKHIQNASYNLVPIKGIIDQLVEYDDHVDVVDFKTGTYYPKNTKPPLGDEDYGGKYWQQAVFYKILCDNEPELRGKVTGAIIDYIKQKDDKIIRKSIPLSNLETALLGEQIEEVWSNIQSHQFEEGCEEEDCRWCNFVKVNFPD